MCFALSLPLRDSLKEGHVILEYVAEISFYQQHQKHLPTNLVSPFVRALAKLIVLVKTSVLSEALS